MKGNTGAGPTEQSFYTLRLRNALLSSTSQIHTVVYTVYYTALLTERKDIAGSS